MVLRIHSNIAASISANSLRTAARSYDNSIERLTTGKSVNSAADNAAAFAMSAKLSSQILTAEQSIRNINDSISLLQTFEASAYSVVDMLTRMKQLAIASSNATLSATDVNALRTEYEQLREQIFSVAAGTHWNGFNLYDGTIGTNGVLKTNIGDGVIDLDLGTTLKQLTNTAQRSATPNGRTDGSIPHQLTISDAAELRDGDVISFLLSTNNVPLGYSFRFSQADIDILNSNSTATINAESLYVSNNGLSLGYSISLSGNADAGTLNITLTHPSITNAFFTLDHSVFGGYPPSITPNFYRGELGILDRLIISPPNGNESVMKTLNKAINEMSLKMSKVGSFINRLESAADVTSEMNKNLKSSRSRITDTDYTRETVNLSRAKITSQAASGMLKTSNDMKKLVVTLLR
jgi:flagellin